MSLRGKNDDEIKLDNTHLMINFCFNLNIFFTLSKVISAFRKKGIEIFGTAQVRKTWTPLKLANISENSVNFNDFYYYIDENRTLVGN